MGKTLGVSLGVLLGVAGCVDSSVDTTSPDVASGQAELRTGNDAARAGDDDRQAEGDDDLQEALARLRRRGASLTLSTTPSGVAAGDTFAVTATFVDGRGRRLPLSHVPVTLTFTPPLIGPLTAVTHRGIARFAGLSTHRAGALTITASATVVSTSGTLSIAPGPAAAVTFGPLPASIIVGAALDPPVELTVTDAFGNSTGDGLEATLFLMRDGDLEPSATFVAKIVEGRATFHELVTPAPGAGFYLRAAVAGVVKDSAFFVSQCGLSTVDCDGYCRDLTTDPGNCGGCGIACDPGAACSGGSCAAPLAVMSTTPAAGATGVVPRKLGGVEVVFTDTLDPATVAGAVGVAVAGGSPLAGTLETLGNRVLFHPAAGQLVENQTLVGTVSAGVASVAGAVLSQAFTWRFEMLPSHGAPYLSRAGVGSEPGARDYYAQLPFGTQCTWDWMGWSCDGRGVSSTFEQWLLDFTWVEDHAAPTLGTTVSYYNRDDLALGRRATCFQNTGGTANPGTYCFVTNHGPVPGSPDHPDPTWALADTVANRAPSSISMIFRTPPDEVETATAVVTEAIGTSARFLGGRLNPGDLVTIGPATGTIWAGNIFFGDNGPDGVGPTCTTTIFDPAPCPLEGAPLYGLLVNTPPAITPSGATISGRRFIGTSTLTFKVTGQASDGFYFSLNDHLAGNGHGELSIPVTVRRASTVSFQVYVPGSSGYTPLVTATTLDGEGNKLVPQACMACHGGHLDPDTGTVTGASFLPFDVGRLVLPNVPGYRRADQEFAFFVLNQYVLGTRPNALNPHDPVRSWIRGTYGGTQTARDDYTPPDWSGDVRLYQQVVRPYCQVCHQALGPGLDFYSAAQFRALSAAIQQDVCVTRTMPHAEATFTGFWQSGAAQVVSEELLGGAHCGP